MIGLLRSEALKLRTITMNWVLGIIAVLFPVAITIISTAATSDDQFAEARSSLEVLSGTNRVAIMLLGVIAAVSMTNEYGFGTIRPTFAATPKRGRVIIAKGVVAVVTAMLLDTMLLLIGWFGANAVVADRADGTSLDLMAEPGLREMLIGSVVLAGLAALAAYGIGMIVRSTPASVALFLLWPLLVESIVGGVLYAITKNEHVMRWLPFNAGFSLGDLGSGSGSGFGEAAGFALTRVQSGLYFGAVAVGIALLGTLSVQRRDA